MLEGIIVSITAGLVSGAVGGALGVVIALKVVQNDITWLKDGLKDAHHRIDSALGARR